MPGNDVGDRVHNFFEQGSLSQDHRHTQFVEGNWPVFNNNLWGGSERQLAGPLNPSSKNYNAQQSDIDRGQGNQFSLGSHGLNFIQSNLRPEFVKNSSQLQQLNLNGYMHSPQVVPARQNEANFLGVDTEPDRHNLTSRAPPILESQQTSSSQHANSACFGGSESPMNFNFLGGQQQMSGQQSGMLQSMPRQQSSINDAQILMQQQQVVLKQMQELQRRQQLQQLEAMQRNAAGQMSTFPSQMVGQHSPAINGNPLNNASNYPWASQVMAGNRNWPQHGPSSAVQGYSNGLMVTPEQGQAMRLMGLFPQQACHSLYGVPVSNSRTSNPYSHQVPAPGSSFSGNQYAPLSEHVSIQDGTTVSRSGSEGKSPFEIASSQGLGNVVSAGSFNQSQQKNVSISEGGRQDSDGGSELVPEKSVTQPASLQASVALDPTEEKILFGNDDNIWEAFGGSSITETGGANRLDGTDLFNGLSTVQSGTWSALMQSAVAETSTNDAGVQEEWSGLDSQNSRLLSGYQPPSALHVNEKQPPIWVDSSQRASLGSRAGTNDLRTINYHNNSGLQQPFLNQTQSQVQEGRKWWDYNQLKSHAEPNQALENANSSRDFSRTNAGFRSHQQNNFLPQNSDQPSSRPSALNFIGSLPANGGIASANQDNFHENVRSRDMSMDASHDATVRLKSVPNSNVKMGSPHVNSIDDAATPNLSNMKVNHESGQKLPDSNHLDLWKPVNSSVQSGIEGSEKDHHNLTKGPPILESSITTSDGGAAEMHEADNGDRREILNDSYRSNIPHDAPPVGLRENLWSDAGERLGLPGGKEKPSGLSTKKPSVTRKFQYHPMGDVDMNVESSYAAKHVLHSQPMSHHSSTTDHETQRKFIDPLSNNSMDLEKGGVSSFQEADKMSHGVASSGTHPGYFPVTSAPFVGSGEISSSNQRVLSSQNMLELLHKVDQSKEQNVFSDHSSSDCNRLSDIIPHGPGGLNRSQSSTSHGINLQLAPPSQGVVSSNLHFASQSSSRPVDSPSSGQMASDVGEKAHAWLGPVSSSQCLSPSILPPQMQSGSNRSGILGSTDGDGSLQNLKGKLSAPLASGSLYLRNSLQNQHMTAAGGKMITDKSAALSFDRHIHRDHQTSDSQNQDAAIRSINNSHHNLAFGRGMNQSGMGALMHQKPSPPTAVMPGMSKKDNQSPLAANLWTSQQHLLGAQGNDSSDLMKSEFPSNNTSETSSFPQQKKDDQDGPRKVDASSCQGTVGRDEPLVAEVRSTGQTVGASHEEEPIMRHPSDSSPSNSSASQNFEAFHRSSKSNNVANNSYSLLHQMQSMKSMVTDPSHRESKRLKGSDNVPDTQLIAGKAAQPFSGGLNNVVRDPSINQASVSAGDAKMGRFSPQPGNRNAIHFPHGAVASQDVRSFGCNDPQKFTAGNLARRSEHTGISPQMAPSWFEQYGTLKNGQLLPVNNVPRIPVNKNAEQQFISGKSPQNLVAHGSVQPTNPVADISQIANTCQTMSEYTPSEHVSSLDVLVPLVPTPNLASLIHKKRKTATADLLPWNKEVGRGIKRLQNMSSAEMDWAQSSNHLVEKFEDEPDRNEDFLLMIRPRRRLTLTTQLMQQMFQPPSTAVLSLDASSNYEVIVHSLARSTLGDACSRICCMDDDPPEHLECGNLLSEKVKTSERIRCQYFTKVMEGFSNRTKELENDLIRLDKHASILDIRLDCQDLERFSVINRFARFHGRSQIDGAEISSSSDAITMAQKPCPQRYVSAHPMPRTVPERRVRLRTCDPHYPTLMKAFYSKISW